MGVVPASRHVCCSHHTRWCPSSLAKLVYNSHNYGLWLFMADITIVNGAYKPTYNWGAPSCMLHVWYLFFFNLFDHMFRWFVLGKCWQNVHGASGNVGNHQDTCSGENVATSWDGLCMVNPPNGGPNFSVWWFGRAFFQMIGYDGINFTYQNEFMVPKGIIDEKIIMFIHRERVNTHDNLWDIF